MAYDIMSLFPDYIKNCDYVKSVTKRAESELSGYMDATKELFEEAYITEDVRDCWGDIVFSPLFNKTYQSNVILKRLFKPCKVATLEDFKEYICGWIDESKCSVEYDPESLKVTVKTTENENFVEKNYKYIRAMTPCNMILEFSSVNSL